MSAVVIPIGGWNEELVHYEVLGRGKPLLFLHGWVGSWRYWIPTMQAVAFSFRAYALDLWGFGDSAKQANLYALDEQVQLIARFMEVLGIPKIALVGHGLGAVTAALFAQRHPQLVDRVMLTAYPLQPQALQPRLLAGVPSDLADWLLGKVPESEAARLEAPKADPQALLTSLTGARRLDLAALPAALTTPCLLSYGVNDPAVACPSWDALLALPEQVHPILFEESGHFPMLEEAGKYHRLLIDFLSLGAGVSPRQLQLKEEWKRRVR